MHKKLSLSFRLTGVGVCVLLLVTLTFVVLGQNELALGFFLALILLSVLVFATITLRTALKHNSWNLNAISRQGAWFSQFMDPSSRVKQEMNKQNQPELEPFQFDARTPAK